MGLRVELIWQKMKLGEFEGKKDGGEKRASGTRTKKSSICDIRVPESEKSGTEKIFEEIF